MFCVPTLTDAQRVTYTQQLTEAQAAYHQLMLGKQIVRVRDQTGEMVDYGPANIDRLESYISRLTFMLGLGIPNVRPPLAVFGGRR